MKRNLVRTAGILAVVFGAIMLFSGIIFLAVGTADPTAVDLAGMTWAEYKAMQAVMCGVGGYIMVISLAQLIVGAVLLGNLNNQKVSRGLVIALIVFGAMGSVLVLAFAIAALCSKEESALASTAVSIAAPQDEFTLAAARVKQYLADGIITEAEYKKKIEELAKKHAENMLSSK